MHVDARRRKTEFLRRDECHARRLPRECQNADGVSRSHQAGGPRGGDSRRVCNGAGGRRRRLSRVQDCCEVYVVSRVFVMLPALVCMAILPAAAQRRPTAKVAEPPLAPAQTVAAQIVCPSPLGTGVTTKIGFCDVMTGSKPSDGIVITLPPHKGPVKLTFN